ncbi:hypothetical protein MNBD_PLANCTO02-2394 [hydrothermal vent metagenome]|uniref:Uncharacterized protein n=1 Tax=hydrothermal vent metagenome TaxID=652676 RepID=A0A3B1DZ77_9ZZZZ
MATAQKTKAADKQNLSKKLVGTLKKYYKGAPRKTDLSVLETILYGVCLENTSYEDADAAFKRLKKSFCDFNEMRVSSISELTDLFDGLPHAEKRALQVRGVLQYIFEKSFDFDFESLRRKTLEQGARQLGRVKDLSSFVRLFTLQNILGGHIIPLDSMSKNISVWFGFLEHELSLEEASEGIKSIVKKAEVPLYCYFLRCLATDARFVKQFSEDHFKKEKKEIDLDIVLDRLTKLLSKSTTTRKKTTTPKTKKNVTKKVITKKPAAKKSSPARKKTHGKKTVKKKTVKKTVKKKVTSQKPKRKKPSTKKKTVKKPIIKKKKSAPKKKSSR